MSRITAAAALGIALLLAPAPPARAAPGYAWPLTPRPAVVREFAPPAQRWLPGHRGIDLAAVPGASVTAAGAGTVHFAGRIAGRIVISVRHPNGLLSTYEPLNEPQVTVGQSVRVGTRLGYVSPGHRGCAVPACLHWGLRRGSGRSARYYDPRLLVGAAHVRLLPGR